MFSIRVHGTVWHADTEEVFHLSNDPRKKYRRATQRLQEAVAMELRRGVINDDAASAWIGKQSKEWKYIVSVVNPENPNFGDVARIDPDKNEILFFIQERWDWVNADPTLRCFGMWKDDNDVTHLDINLALPRSLENFSLAYRAARHFCQTGIWNGKEVQSVKDFGKSIDPALQTTPLAGTELERIYFPFTTPTTVPVC